MMNDQHHGKSSKWGAFWLSTLLWMAALLLMLAAAVYQRTTGPTRPLGGSFELAGSDHGYKLIRTEWSIKTVEGATVEIPDPGVEGLQATLHYKRYRTADDFSPLPMIQESGDDGPLLTALLPGQPAAGKLEYYITLNTTGEEVRIPPAAESNVVIRFKDHVPISVLLPHIFMMFFSVLIGMRAGLGALFSSGGMRRWAWISLGGMTVGGMMLGPIVQKYAFGDYWTGWPLGGDWTDNKMLFMWLSWVIACLVIGFRPRRFEKFCRAVVLAAALVMSGVYLIPHSMGGSELDYSQIEEGVDPAEAIKTGRH